MNDKRICKQCLLSEMEESEYFESVFEYISLLNDDVKTPAKEYEKRLLICKNCEKLVNGLCAVCGCFVEMRAAVFKNYCPYSKEKW